MDKIALKEYTLKIQNIVPFYFDNIENQTWSSESLFNSLEEVLKLLERQFRQPMFKLEKQKFDDTQQQFNYLIGFKKTNPIAKYFNGLNLSITIDWKNKIVNGGFSINHSYEENANINDLIEDIYLKSLMKNFISKQFFPLNMQNLVDIINKYDFEKNTSFKKRTKLFNNKFTETNNDRSLISFKNITIDDIYGNWTNLIERKYLNFDEFDEEEVKDYKYDWLFANLVIYSLITLIVNLLKLDFRKITKTFDVSTEASDKEDNMENLFYLLTKFVKLNFDVKDYRSVFNIGFPSTIYSLYNNDEKVEYYDENFFLKDSNLKILYFLCMTPEVFGIDSNSSHFIEFSQLKNVVFKSNYGSHRKMSEAFEEKVDFHTCEESYNFRTFINEEGSVLIVSRGENDLFDEYFWSQVYLSSRNQIYLQLNYEVNSDNAAVKRNANYWREKHQLLENIIFSEYDNFLVVTDLKDTVLQMEKTVDYKSSWQSLLSQIFLKENSYKQQYEHKVLSFALIVAAVIGFINFFAMIFTVMAVGKDGGVLDTTNIVVICITSILATVLFTIAIFYMVTLIKDKVRMKKINQVK
ncbi:hypothetical protein [Ureaplasma ceti]|uniref:Uncharacterized protein n=1 Tax=Ureaplasma ceti TaxID=3119530 RepID=A0ABP9U7A8_9BACT